MSCYAPDGSDTSPETVDNRSIHVTPSSAREVKLDQGPITTATVGFKRRDAAQMAEGLDGWPVGGQRIKARRPGSRGTGHSVGPGQAVRLPSHATAVLRGIVRSTKVR